MMNQVSLLRIFSLIGELNEVEMHNFHNVGVGGKNEN